MIIYYQTSSNKWNFTYNFEKLFSLKKNLISLQ